MEQMWEGWQKCLHIALPNPYVLDFFIRGFSTW